MVSSAISIDHVSKSFRLPVDRPSTFKQRVLHPRLSRRASILEALRDVSFEIGQGEFFGIIGRNGSGKSTLLKCMAGIYTPDGGDISVKGRLSPFIELGVGFNPELTARDNIVVNAALVGISRSDALSRFDDVIRFAELEEFVDLKLKNYSSGMQVRLGFAAAVQVDADIFLVDEVLAVGDARFQEKCFDTFRQMKHDGKTVVYVTHDLGTVERFCDRAVLLERGELEFEGAPHKTVMTYRQRDLELGRRAEGAAVRAPQEGRWGDGAVDLEDAWFENGEGERIDMIEQHDRVTFKFRAYFTEAIDGPVFGVIFKNENGQPVFATNNLFDGESCGAVSSGESILYSISFEMHFGDGAYTCSPSVTHSDVQRIADWREDFVSFRVSAPVHSGSAVDLPTETRIERLPQRSPQPAQRSG